MILASAWPPCATAAESFWVAGPPAPSGPELVPRSEHASCYDSARGRVIVFGGEIDYTASNETWEFDGAAWIPGAAAPAGLTARYSSAMTFDSTRGVGVLFGGYGNGYLNDTWEYGALGWTPGPSAPPALLPVDGGLKPRRSGEEG